MSSRKFFLKAAVLALALSTVLPASGQNEQVISTKVEDALAGRAFPITLTLKDLKGDWRRITVNGQGDMSGWMMAGTAFEVLSGGIFYTKGQTVTMGGTTYLVAYRPQVKSLDMSKLMRAGMPTAPEAMTPDTLLALSLLDLRTVGNLTNIQAFDLEQEIAARSDALKAFQRQAAMPQPGRPEPAADDASTNDASTNNLSQIGISLAQYAMNHAGLLPPLKDPVKIKKALDPYIHNTGVFNQPETQEPYRANLMLSEQLQENFQNPTETVVFYEAKPAADGTRAVLFLSGQAKRIKETDWPHFKKISKIP